MSRFAWCESPMRAVNVHAACRRTYTANGRTHVCECPCHAGQTGVEQGRIGRAEQVRQHPSGSDHPSFSDNERG